MCRQQKHHYAFPTEMNKRNVFQIVVQSNEEYLNVVYNILCLFPEPVHGISYIGFGEQGKTEESDLLKSSNAATETASVANGEYLRRFKRNEIIVIYS